MTILPSLNTLATTQSKPTVTTKQKIDQLLDYLETHPDAKLRYHARYMILHCDSDVVYLVETKARSRVGGFYYLSSKQHPKLNGAIYCECCLISVTMASVAESEVGVLFYNTRNVLPMRVTLQALGHLQPPTPINTDNTTVLGVVTKTIKIRRTKAMDTRFHWIHDSINQKLILVYWDKGKNNYGDYFTKHHPPTHHKLMRPKFLICHATTFLQKILKTHGKCKDTLRGCINSHIIPV